MYLKCHILLLADVFENFRKECINYIELDPAHYLSNPGYSWDTTLTSIGISLKSISEIKKFSIKISCFLEVCLDYPDKLQH